MKTIRDWARKLKQKIMVLYFSCKDERIPWYAKLFTAFVVGFAFSPIDLIPDFIPILGLLDDLILVPLGIRLAMGMIPEEVLADSEAKAEEKQQSIKPRNWMAGLLILLMWLALLVWITLEIFYP
ncbi:YkvA family protein [Virgibacillus sp. MSP4-1]|uniref:YkvA family protein n=1 Tax=Virgibacillus sp. MSP4-1 TaxID=2700081 RepID=UPI0003AAA6DF|nr:DUF1232 domain-containing protein [Virgibacillus sp. MSP4-1]